MLFSPLIGEDGRGEVCEERGSREWKCGNASGLGGWN